MNSHQDELFKLVEQWASHFGYYDGSIDLKSGGDLTEFCTKTMHFDSARTFMEN